MTPDHGAPTSSPATYTERLPVPLGIWVVVAVLWLVFTVALAAALGPWIGLALLVLGGAGIAYGLRSAAGRVEVVDGALVAGPARLPLTFAGPAVALDAEAARHLRGPGADARAYLYLKGWVPTAVRVEVVDASDPAPYWYVSSRRPAALVAAIDAAR